MWYDFVQKRWERDNDEKNTSDYSIILHELSFSKLNSSAIVGQFPL